jgi:hypothetical protein
MIFSPDELLTLVAELAAKHGVPVPVSRATMRTIVAEAEQLAGGRDDDEPAALFYACVQRARLFAKVGGPFLARIVPAQAHAVGLERHPSPAPRGGAGRAPAALPAQVRDGPRAQIRRLEPRRRAELDTGPSAANLPHAPRGEMPHAAARLHLLAASRACPAPGTGRPVLRHRCRASAVRGFPIPRKHWTPVAPTCQAIPTARAPPALPISDPLSTIEGGPEHPPPRTL